MAKRRFALINASSGEAPSDGKTYGRLDGEWVVVFTDDVLTLTGGTLSTATRAGAIAIKDLKFDQDGNVYEKDTPGSYTQLEASTDWVVPETDAEDFQIRYISASGTGLSSSGTENVWHLMSAGDFIMTIADNTTGDGPETASFTIEIRFGTNPTLANVIYTLAADKSA